VSSAQPVTLGRDSSLNIICACRETENMKTETQRPALRIVKIFLAIIVKYNRLISIPANVRDL
jgi:hypothetical protein